MSTMTCRNAAKVRLRRAGRGWRGLLALGAWGAGLLCASIAWPLAGRAADAAGEELLLGRLPALFEHDRKLAAAGLKDILALVLERNFALQANRVSQGASRQSLTAAQERLQPVLSGGLGVSHSVTPGLTPAAPLAGNLATSFMSLLAQDSVTFSTGVTQQDWYGATYSLNYQEARTQAQNLAIINAGDAPRSTKPANLVDISSLAAAVAVPLAQNAGRDFNRIPVGQAEVGLRLSRLTTRQQEQTALNSAALAYWNLVGQLETISVFEQAVKLDEQLVSNNQQRVRAGTRVPSDVLGSETQLALDRRNLVQARLQALNLEDQLRAALGLDAVDFGFKPTDTPSLRPSDYDPGQQLERVYRNSPLLGSLEASLDNKNYDLLAARNAAKPLVNLGLSYTLNGYSQDVLGGAATFDQARTQGEAAALNASAPLLDRVGPANVQRRLDERRSLELQIRDQRNALAIQLQNVLRNIHLAREQIATARTAVALAQLQLDNEVKRLQLGSSTPFLVAQVQQQFNRARQDEIAARIQFEQNDMARLVLTGDIYAQFGLTSLTEESGR
jgi:outer membrane protein TolC